MSSLGGLAERVGLYAATLADTMGHIDGDVRRLALANRAVFGVGGDPLRKALHRLMEAGCLKTSQARSTLMLRGDGEAAWLEASTRAATPRAGGKPMLVHRYNSETGDWEAPIEVGEYLARRVAA